jgi:hypothetical protein
MDADYGAEPWSDLGWDEQDWEPPSRVREVRRPTAGLPLEAR